MNLQTLDWDDELLEYFTVPRQMLPQIRPSSDPDLYGMSRRDGPFKGEVPISADLGDQQAATVGQVCTSPGDAKKYLWHRQFHAFEYRRSKGLVPIRSSHHCLLQDRVSTCSFLPSRVSIAVTGSAVQWLRDQLGILDHASDVESLAKTVEDSAGMYFVPAFSGLFAPYWRSDARGAIVGLSRYHSRAHLARATLEAICYQTRDVLDAMANDSGDRLAIPQSRRRSDGQRDPDATPGRYSWCSGRSPCCD